MSRLGRKAKKSSESNKTYAELEYFSQRHRQWARYHVLRPRLPKPTDERWLETVFQPRTLKSYVGKHNNEIIETLSHIRDNFEIGQSFPSQFVLYGPPGSGKSALVRTLLREMNESCGVDQSNSSKWILQIDCEKVDITKLWNKISHFGSSSPDHSIPMAFKIIVLDGADLIPPSAQQILKKRPDEAHWSHTLTGIDLSDKEYERERCCWSVYPPSPCFSSSLYSETLTSLLAMLLIVLSREQIGYNREGIREIFQQIEKVQLREIIEALQAVFLKRHYISAENVQKYFAEKRGIVLKIPITKQAALEPLARCPICTLHPPCQHISLEQLEIDGMNRRAELPRYKKGLVCQQFLTTGHCNLFNKYGRCSLDHPQNVHTIIPAIPKCSQCTLVWPCNHCSYSVARRELEDALNLLKTKLALLYQIALPAPPIALTSHLVDEYPNFREDLLRLKAEMTLEKERMLKNTQNWFLTSLTVNKEEYMVKLRLVQLTFYNIFNSPLLLPPPSSVQGNKATNRQQQQQQQQQLEQDNSSMQS